MGDQASSYFNFNPRSPYGERQPLCGINAIFKKFQSTLPIRGATCYCLACSLFTAISIHAPHTGSDIMHKKVKPAITLISIHAPHTGSDLVTSGVPRILRIFQSTLPIRGATIIALSSAFTKSLFQSTLPIRGATDSLGNWFEDIGISIHAPHTGSDRFAGVAKTIIIYFNPRSPYGERLPKDGFITDKFEISIHAPHTGSDEEALGVEK